MEQAHVLHRPELGPQDLLKQLKTQILFFMTRVLIPLLTPLQTVAEHMIPQK